MAGELDRQPVISPTTRVDPDRLRLGEVFDRRIAVFAAKA
jgi:hypothetical protein